MTGKDKKGKEPEDQTESTEPTEPTAPKPLPKRTPGKFRVSLSACARSAKSASRSAGGV
jgi:hypothetical protein